MCPSSFLRLVGLGPFLVFALAATAVEPVSSHKDLKLPPLNSIQVPEPERVELPNGMVLHILEDHELPLINLTALIRVGSRWEPSDQAGLASMVGSVMRTGGTPTRNGDQLDDELDQLGASVETWISEDSGGALVSVLKEDIETGLNILADVLQHPAFPEDKIELAKIAQRDAIARRNDDPGGIAYREFDRVIYGKNSPYARQPEYATLNAIAREDFVKFHRDFFQPENVILAVWGDFSAGEMKSRIEKAFAGWARGGKPKPTIPPVDAAAQERAGYNLINKEDVNQSTVVLGHLGGQRKDPDFYALNLMNRILGGGFASRLFIHVRTEQGLAYTVSSSWSAGWDRPGLFVASGRTKSENTTKILGAIRQEIQRLREAEVDEDELARAKDGILKGFAFEFDSTGKIIQRLITYEYYGYPRDYLQRYRDNIDKVTRADILRVARKHLQPDQLAVLVLGKADQFDQKLSTLGPVKDIDITIPAP